MNMKRQVLLLATGILISGGLGLQGHSTTSRNRMNRETERDSIQSLGEYFTDIASAERAPDAEGFIQRWLLLEPVNKPNRSNTVFTDSYIRAELAPKNYPGKFNSLPKSGDKIKAGGQELMWHALDSRHFNVKLYRFAHLLGKETYGVLFWTATVVNSQREMKNVRMAVGSNSASMWWLNGQEAVMLSGDRRMVMDDCVSKRLTLNKGKNILKGAVINGPGMSDFCVRFLDERGQPVKDITVSYK